MNGPFPLSAGLRYAVECRGVRLRGIELGGLGKPSPSQCCQAGAAREVLSGRQSRSAAHRLLRKASISNTRDSCLSWGRDLLVLFRHNPASEYSPEFENLALDRARTCVPTGSSILAAITGRFARRLHAAPTPNALPRQRPWPRSAFRTDIVQGPQPRWARRWCRP